MLHLLLFEAKMFLKQALRKEKLTEAGKVKPEAEIGRSQKNIENRIV